MYTDIMCEYLKKYHSKYWSFQELKKWLHRDFVTEKSNSLNSETLDVIKHLLISYIYVCEIKWYKYNDMIKNIPLFV